MDVLASLPLFVTSRCLSLSDPRNIWWRAYELVEFKGNVAAVYTHPLEHTPGSSGGHYGHDAYTYMNVGEAMGRAMVGLLQKQD